MPSIGAGSGRVRLVGALLCPRCRSKRVIVLLVGVVLMSLGDLYMTLEYATKFGMLESNPFARAIMSHGSPAGLIAWKLCTVLLAAGILVYARRRLSAELGAVFCCIVMTWLTVRWIDYSDHVSKFTHEGQALAAEDEQRWVSMQPETRSGGGGGGYPRIATPMSGTP